MALEKESLINFLPDGFETLNQEGYKENFSADKIATGYEKDIKDRVTGPNLNNLIDVIGKNTNILNNYIEYLNNMPIGSVPIINENNNLDYASGFVQKSGDTMTGDLIVENDVPVITLKNSNIESSVPPDVDSGAAYFAIHDKNGQTLGIFGLEQYTNGKQTVKLQAFSADGSTAPAVRVNAYANNTIGCDFPKCTTKATTTSSARSDLVAVVVQNYVSGTSWYRVWSDGWIEQGGKTTSQESAEFVVKLLKAFSNTNYNVQVTDCYYDDSAGGWGYAHSKTTTQFKTVQTTQGCHWFACGY